MTDTSLASVRDQKNIQRKAAEATRKSARAALPDAGRMMCTQFLQNITLPANSIVASYMARGSELDPSQLDLALSDQGHAICLPAVIGKHHPLAFRAYQHGDPLIVGMFDIPEPQASAKIVIPTVILVPMLAFDVAGRRLGYGGGFYDRSISLLRREGKVLAAGVAFSAQELPEVAAGPNDVKLDWIVTEKDARRF